MATDWSKLYFEGKAAGDADKMEYANKQANKERGLGEIVTATEDIAKVRARSQTAAQPTVVGVQQSTTPAIVAAPTQTGGTVYQTSDGGSWAEPAATQQKALTTADVQKAVNEALAARAQQEEQRQSEAAEYLKQQQAAQLERSLSGLKSAYEQSMAGYQRQRDKLPVAYDEARNRTAAQSAMSQQAFNERAAASGLGTGTTGQAALTRSATLRSNLAQLDRAQAQALADIDAEEADLATQYQNALAQARATSDATLADNLYQEMVRAQSLERQDAQLAAQRAIQAEQTAYNRDQTARSEAQQRINAYLSALGAASDLDGGLVAQSGYTPAELSALEDYYARQLAGTATVSKPTLTASQAYNAYYKNGIRTQEVADALKYYYGIDVGGGSAVSGTAPAGTTPTGTTSAGYDNGGLSNEAVAQMQSYFGLTPDGYWGPNSQQTTGMTATEAWARYSAARAAARQGAALAATEGSTIGRTADRFLGVPTPIRGRVATVPAQQTAQTAPAQETTETPEIDWRSVYDLGQGLLTNEELAQLVRENRVEPYLMADGRMGFRWAAANRTGGTINLMQ